MTEKEKVEDCWSKIEECSRDPILYVDVEYKNDPFPQKVNLSIGAYKDENGNPYVLKVVEKATDILIARDATHEYIPVSGMPDFCKNAVKIAYDDNFKYLDKLVSIQSISGTGGLCIGQNFLGKFYPYIKKIYFPNPTWQNHLDIAKEAKLQIGRYRYYDSKTKGIDFEGLCEDLKNVEEHSIVLFHACAHNPTGADPSHEQWEKILKIVQEKKILPFFDMAYQGFATGNLNEDAFSVRLFANTGMNMIVVQSFSKNLGLYGERAGCLSILAQNEKEKFAIQTNIEKIIRSIYSSPPKFGAKIANIIFSDETLRKEWIDELNMMGNRIKDMRIALKNKLVELGSKKNWDHLTNQKGMFAFTGLSPEQCERLKKEFHIYLISNGRIACPGLNKSNVDYVAKAFHEVTKDN